MGARLTAIRVTSPVAFGEVTLLPAALTARSEPDMGRAMAEALADVEPSSAADALGRLRQAFPTAPISARVAALGVMMDRIRGAF